jgi:hypothetical protein
VDQEVAHNSVGVVHDYVGAELFAWCGACRQLDSAHLCPLHSQASCGYMPRILKCLRQQQVIKLRSQLQTDEPFTLLGECAYVASLHATDDCHQPDDLKIVCNPWGRERQRPDSVASNT